ncbi:MAG: DUF3048 domain-containing protein [Patescibacteria group bacterium]
MPKTKNKKFKSNSQIYIFLFCLILFLTGYLISKNLFLPKNDLVAILEEEQVVVSPFCENFNLLNNRCLENNDSTFYYGVMIENHGEARPQAGLSKADFVFETIVEAPITRFLAIFSSDKTIEKIGPVRSARPYYVEWAREFNIPYLHVGGSNEAIDLLKKTTVFDLNEFYNGRYFWRDKNRFAPHNVYTSSEEVATAVKNKGWEFKNDFGKWNFFNEQEEKNLTVGQTQKVIIDFGSSNYNVEWVFDQEKKEYGRWQNGRIFVDDSGEQIIAKNLVVLYSSSRVIDNEGRRKTATIGSGPAEVHYYGNKIEAVWRRNSLTERTEFFDDLGNKMFFSSGKIWLSVVPDHYDRAVTQIVEENFDQNLK